MATDISAWYNKVLASPPFSISTYTTTLAGLTLYPIQHALICTGWRCVNPSLSFCIIRSVSECLHTFIATIYRYQYPKIRSMPLYALIIWLQIEAKLFFRKCVKLKIHCCLFFPSLITRSHINYYLTKAV